MAGEAWPTVGELQSQGIILVEDGNHGEYRPRREEFGKSGVAFVRAADISDGSVDFTRCEFINGTALRRIRKGIGRSGDILLSHKGTVGKLARVRGDAPPFVCSPQTTFWRVLDGKKLDRDYLYAFMRSPLFASQLASVQGETDMAPYVSLTAQRRLKVAVPDFHQQVAIGRLIGALDEKIELNRRMVRTLEAITEASFKSWFIDFDPVRAKVEGRPTGLPDDLAALFPSSFNADEEPRGWEKRTVRPTLSCFIVRGLSPSYADEGLLVLNQRCIRNGRVDLKKARRHDVSLKRVSEERLIRTGDIVIK
jgi:type I restriction enzyme S subunit